MRRYPIIILIVLAPWFGAASATQTKSNTVTVCECLKVGRQDPLAAACMQLSDSLADSVWDAEVDACEAKAMRVLASHIQDCTEIVQEFVHPWTREKLARSITGMKNGTCHYRVGMPQGGKMECRFPRGRLDDIAYYFNNSSHFKNARVESSTSFVDGQVVTKNRYFIEGEEVLNPMQESLDNGECVVSIPKM